MFLLFFVIWIVLNGQVNAEVLGFGLLVSGLLTVFCSRVMGYSLARDRFFFRQLGRELGYFFHLVKEIIHAAFVIMRIIYSRRGEMEPRLIYFKSGLRTPEAKSVLANSITLTAGTITVDVAGDGFCVHTLDAPLADGIENSTFANKLHRLEG